MGDPWGWLGVSPLPHGRFAAPRRLGPLPTGTVAHIHKGTPVLDLTDFKRDLSELTDRLGHAQDCL